jgi:multiple sugar transport system substrate-binding protein
VPQTGFPFFIYYRKDLYEAAGLPIPETHEQLLANAAALHNPPDTYGFIVTNQALSDTWNLKSAMWTHGAYYFDENDQLALDRPETLAAWQFYKDLAAFSPPGSMSQSDLESRQLYVDGKVAHMLTTTSMAANFTPEDLPRFGGFLYPQKEGAKGASLDFQGNTIPTKAQSPELARAAIAFQLDPENFQEYLLRTVVGWVPMLQDAYTDAYLDSERIAPIREFIELGGVSLQSGVIGAGYWGPSANETVLTATDVEKQIGDRLVVDGQSPEEVMAFALETINAAL